MEGAPAGSLPSSGLLGVEPPEPGAAHEVQAGRPPGPRETFPPPAGSAGSRLGVWSAWGLAGFDLRQLG